MCLFTKPTMPTIKITVDNHLICRINRLLFEMGIIFFLYWFSKRPPHPCMYQAREVTGHEHVCWCIEVSYVYYDFSVGLRNCCGSFLLLPFLREMKLVLKQNLKKKYPQRPTSYWSICFYFAWFVGRIPEDYFHRLVSVVK